MGYEDPRERLRLFETGEELVKPHNEIYRKNVSLSVIPSYSV